jgi:hypothetical protein
MIVCRECGTQNADGDQFCGGCPAFLEWSGERIDDGDDEVEEVVDDVERAGLVTRCKHAISGDDLPPPTSGASATSSGSGAATLPPPAADVVGRIGDAEMAGDGSGVPATASADDRAAALVAKPVAEERSAAESAAGTAAAGAATGAKTPQAQIPQAAKKRPQVKKQPPSRKINPGDLICGKCGEGNTADRKFCRRCGNTLVEAVVAKRPWYKRFIPTKKVKRVDAGARPDSGGGGRGVASSGRVFRGKVLGKLHGPKRILGVLALLGLGTVLVVPSLREQAVDRGDGAISRVRRIIKPTYSPISLDPDLAESSSHRAGSDAAMVTDSNTLTYWLARPDDVQPSVTVTFVEPSDVEHVLVHPGMQEDGGKVIRPDPRPRQVLFRVLDESGTVEEVEATLDDEDGFQQIDIGVDAAVSVETIIENCYPDPVVSVCAITELEFQQKD